MSEQLEEAVIRHATVEDADDIIAFLADHWIIENHVFTRRRDLFDNCHLIGGCLTFIVARGVESDKLYGILGYAFNNCNFEQPDISAVIFQTLKTANPSLGIDMILELQKLTNCRVLFCPGIIKKTKGIYDFLGYETGMLKQYYKLNECADFKIAHIENIPAKASCPSEQFDMRRLESMEDIRNAFDFERYQDAMPYRDAWSVEQRYFTNIGYDYEVHGIFDADECRALVVGREIACNDSKMFKIVDFLGDDEALAHVGKAFDEFVEARGLEYVDFYEVGIDDDVLERAGFALRLDGDANIVPNYFEPFEQRNIDICYYTTWKGKFHIYRSDSGQDRPNFIDEIEG